METEVPFLQVYPNWMIPYELFRTLLIPYLDSYLLPEGEDQPLGSTCWVSQHKCQQTLIEQPLFNSDPDAQG